MLIRKKYKINKNLSKDKLCSLLADLNEYDNRKNAILKNIFYYFIIGGISSIFFVYFLYEPLMDSFEGSIGFKYFKFGIVAIIIIMAPIIRYWFFSTSGGFTRTEQFLFSNETFRDELMIETIDEGLCDSTWDLIQLTSFALFVFFLFISVVYRYQLSYFYDNEIIKLFLPYKDYFPIITIILVVFLVFYTLKRNSDIRAIIRGYEATRTIRTAPKNEPPIKDIDWIG